MPVALRGFVGYMTSGAVLGGFVGPLTSRAVLSFVRSMIPGAVLRAFVAHDSRSCGGIFWCP